MQNRFTMLMYVHVCCHIVQVIIGYHICIYEILTFCGHVYNKLHFKVHLTDQRLQSLNHA